MLTLEQIEAAIESLPPEDFKKLRSWMTEYEADAWDRQIEEDALSGKLDHLVEQAREHKRQGRCRPL
ncbi:MAG: hypothetical protein AB7U20_17635 [Planctomycetaceae bacterium]